MYKKPPKEGYSTLLDYEEGETEAQYWRRTNRHDKNSLRLFCQSCCARYPDECLDKDLIHPYDRGAESCPDFIPKDMDKGESKAKCWKKRLKVDPEYLPP